MEELPGKRFFRPDEVAEHFRVSRSYVYWMVRNKKLKAVKIGKLIRVPREECRRICQSIK
jgi:excisionase family DNA binding protein